MTPVFYKTVLEQNPALRRAEVRDAAALEQINGVAAAVPTAHAGIYAKAMQKVKAAQQEQRELVTEQQGQVEVAEENAAVMSDMVALPAEASQGESLVLAQASQAQREAPAPKSKSANSPEDEGFGIAWQGGIAALGLFALGAGGGGGGGASSTADVCDFNTDLDLPSRPSAASALVIDVAPGDDEIQGSGSAGVEYTADHSALLITVGDHANLHGEGSVPGNFSGFLYDPFVVNASVDMGDIYYSAGVSATSSVLVNASGSVGDVVIKTSAKTAVEGDENTTNYLAVSAGGDVGNVYFLASGAEAGGGFYNLGGGNFAGVSDFEMGIDASGGNVGDVNVRLANPDGGAWLNVSAYAVSGAGGLVGGGVGDVNFIIDGLEASGQVYVQALGGDVGDVTFTTVGGSGSGKLYVSAIAQIDASGNVYGGNVGDITSNLQGYSADNDLYVNTSGAVGVGGVYLGGGNVGNVTLNMCNEGTAEADSEIRVRAYSGGSVGNVYASTSDGSGSARVDVEAFGVINGDGFYEGGGNIGNVTIFSKGSSGTVDAYLTGFSGGSVGAIELIVTSEDQAHAVYSASANVNAIVYGAGGQIATIGDVTMDVYGGLDNSASVSLSGYSGAEIGDIVAHVHGGQEGGHGSVSGHINISAFAYANVDGSGGVIGDISVIDTSFEGDTEIGLYADTRIGNVSVATGEGSANVRLSIGAGSGATVGDVTIELDAGHFDSGGYLNMNFSAGAVDMGDVTITGGSEYSTFDVSGGSSVNVGNIDASDFLGDLDIYLAGVETGVRIDTGAGSSFIAGTQAADDIYLGDGDDTISFNTFDSGEAADNIYDFESGVDVIETYDDGSLAFLELTSNTATTITDGDVVSLVNIAGGDDLSTEAGLLDALNGGEYGLVDTVGGLFTFVTAGSTASTTFNVYQVIHDGSSYTEAFLMADVDMKTGSTFGSLTTSDFA